MDKNVCPSIFKSQLYSHGTSRLLLRPQAAFCSAAGRGADGDRNPCPGSAGWENEKVPVHKWIGLREGLQEIHGNPRFILGTF